MGAVKFIMFYPNYSEEAITQVIEQAIGTPVNDAEGNMMGTVIDAKRVGQFRIEFEVGALQNERLH